MQIRSAVISDAEAIATIYNAHVTGSTATFDLIPRSVDEQRAWLIDRSGAHAVLVAEDDEGTLVGFASLSPFRDRPAYTTTVESSIYVDPTHQRRGLGLRLLEALIATARSHGFHTIIARVADSREASINLHARAGFAVVGVEREVGRKFNRWMDVTIMQLLL